MKNILITSVKKDFDKKLIAVLIREDRKVFAIGNEQLDGVVMLPAELKEAVGELKKHSKHIDIYIDVSDERCPQDNFNVQTGLNEDVMRNLYNANVIQPMAMLEAFLPMLEAGEGKRLCYLTSAEASINETQAIGGYGYKMAKAALHNFLQITRNALAPKGFTIRVYDPMFNDVAAAASAEAAFNYFTRGRGVERGDPYRDDEGNLVFRDAYGRQHAW